MFTGIVEEIGKVKGVNPGRLNIEASKVVEGTKPGDIVNLEVDIIAKYVDRLKQRDNRGVTLDFLEEHGFLKAR